MPYDHVSGSLSRLDTEVVNAVPPGGSWRDLPHDFASARVKQIRESAERGEGSRSTYYGRLRWDRPSYTISTYFSRPGNGCFIHPDAARLITIREAARLQGFPDAYRFTGQGRSRYLQVGNAVPPLLAYQLAGVLPKGTLVDLFSGAGGLSLGFEWAGFSLLAAVDHDAAAAAAFQLNRAGNDLVLCEDLADEGRFSRVISEVKRRAGADGVTVLAGGPPCQGFSTAGSCDLADSRNRLVYSFLEAARLLRPRCILMENVPALHFRRRVSVLRELMSEFAALGYQVEYIIAHAESFGVPQLRRRLFVLATHESDPHWPQPFRQILAPAQLRYQPGAEYLDSCPDPFTVADAISDLPGTLAGNPDEHTDYRCDAESDFQQWARGDAPLNSIVPTPHLFDRSGWLQFAGLPR